MTVPCLLIDAGNTRIKWAVTAAPPVRSSAGDAGGVVWRVRGDCLTGSADDLARELAAADSVLASWPEVRVVYCSVAGPGVNTHIEAQLAGYFQNRSVTVHRFVSTAQVGPLTNTYRQPAQLGADRLSAALGAWERTRNDVVVVCAGTATTIDIVRRDGKRSCRFSGGVILPGLDLMIDSLARRTAGLPMAAGTFQSLPDNTDDAITTGCLLAQAGAIERMRRLLPAGVPCLLAGGAAERLRPLLDAPVIDAPDLVLEGLAAAILHGFDQ